MIEQISYLLFLRMLDTEQRRAENRARITKQPIENPLYGPTEQRLRWSTFKNLESDEMLAVVTHGVFPFLRRLRGDGSPYSHHMWDARFTIPTAQLLSRVVDALRAARHRTLTLLDELTQSAFAAVFGDLQPGSTTVGGTAVIQGGRNETRRNRRPRVERLVSAWNQGIREDAESEDGADDPLTRVSAEPKKRPRTRLTDKKMDAMRTARALGVSVTALASRFGGPPGYGLGEDAVTAIAWQVPLRQVNL